MKIARIAGTLRTAIILFAVHNAAAEDQAPVKIGLSQIASGIAADYWSRQVNKPALLAIEDANQQGWIPGRKVAGILEDNQGSATTGAAVAHKLIEIDKVNMIFVAPTPAALATLPIAEEAGFHRMVSRITVKMRDGRELFAEGEAGRGHPDNPMSDDEVREALEPSSQRTGTSVDELFTRLREADRLERVREDVASRQALELLVREAKPISVEQAKARDKLWTPDKEEAGSGQIWTPGS